MASVIQVFREIHRVLVWQVASTSSNKFPSSRRLNLNDCSRMDRNQKGGKAPMWCHHAIKQKKTQWFLISLVSTCPHKHPFRIPPTLPKNPYLIIAFIRYKQNPFFWPYGQKTHPHLRYLKHASFSMGMN